MARNNVARKRVKYALGARLGFVTSTTRQRPARTRYDNEKMLRKTNSAYKPSCLHNQSLRFSPSLNEEATILRTVIKLSPRYPLTSSAFVNFTKGVRTAEYRECSMAWGRTGERAGCLTRWIQYYYTPLLPETGMFHQDSSSTEAHQEILLGFLIIASTGMVEQALHSLAQPHGASAPESGQASRFPTLKTIRGHSRLSVWISYISLSISEGLAHLRNIFSTTSGWMTWKKALRPAARRRCKAGF